MKAYGKGGNLTPAPKNLLTDGHQNLYRWLDLRRGVPTTVQNFVQIGLGVSFLRMRDFAPLWTEWLGYF